METLNKYYNELLSFHHVAQSKSFTKGSDTLNISKSQASKHIKQIESLLGIQLINRTTRTFHLTQEGQALFDYTSKMVSLINSAANQIRGIAEEDIGELKFSTAPSLGLFLATDVYAEFKKEFPNAHLELDFTNLSRDFNKGEAHIALRVNPIVDANTTTMYMGNWNEVLCVGPEFYKQEKLKKINIEEINKFPCIINSCIRGHNRWEFKKDKQDLSFIVDGPVSCSTFESIIHLCAQNHGIAKIPHFMVDQKIRSGELIQIFSEYKSYGNPIFIVYPKQTYINKKQKVFKEILINWFKKKSNFITKVF